jgi:hypothetical protein
MTDSAAPPRVSDDQVTLIDSQIHSDTSLHDYLFPYLLFKLAPWILYLVFDVDSFTTLILLLVLVSVDIWLCSRVFAYSLVGLSWTLALPFAVSYEFKPDPFVPDPIDSNAFWLALIGTFFFGVVAAIRALVTFKLFSLVVLGAIAGMQGSNVWIYFRCLALAKKQLEETFRTVMTYAPQQFPEAEDIPPGEETVAGEPNLKIAEEPLELE